MIYLKEEPFHSTFSPLPGHTPKLRGSETVCCPLDSSVLPSHSVLPYWPQCRWLRGWTFENLMRTEFWPLPWPPHTTSHAWWSWARGKGLVCLGVKLDLSCRWQEVTRDLSVSGKDRAVECSLRASNFKTTYSSRPGPWSPPRTMKPAYSPDGSCAHQQKRPH